MKKIKCKICNKNFRAITNSHLKIHGLSPQEYKNKYNVKLESIDTVKKRKLVRGDKHHCFGKKRSEETKRKIGEANKGKLSGEKNPSKRIEVRKKISESKMGHFVSQHVKDIASKTHKGKKLSKNHRLILKEKALKNNPMNILENRMKVGKGVRESFINGRNHKGENNPRWMGGIAFEPYGIEFNNELKNRIRNRDNNQCQKCGTIQEELSQLLSVHHIDYDKTNNKESNLISLCISCHTKVGKINREEYFNLFSSMIGGDASDTQKNNFTS